MRWPRWLKWRTWRRSNRWTKWRTWRRSRKWRRSRRWKRSRQSKRWRRTTGQGGARSRSHPGGGNGSELDEGGAPGEAGPEARQDHAMAGLESALADGLIHRQRHAAGGRVAVAVEIVEDARTRDGQHVEGGVDDADVGLVWDVQVHVFGRHAGGLEDILNRVAQDVHGPAEDGTPVHVHVVQPGGQHLRRELHPTPAGGPAEQLTAAAVRAH